MIDVRPLFWILAFAFALLAVITLQQNGTAWNEFVALGETSIEIKILALVIGGIAALALSRQRFSQALRSLLLWVLIVLALALGYTYRSELGEVTDRVLAAFVPGRAVSKGRTV